MGMLGESFDDPKTALIMALSGGLMRGDYGGAMLDANSAYQGAMDSRIKRADMLQQIRLRDLQAQVMQRKSDGLASAFADDGGAAPAVPPGVPGPIQSGMAPTAGTNPGGTGPMFDTGGGTPGVPTASASAGSPYTIPAGGPPALLPPQRQPGGSFMSRMTPDKLAKLKAFGDIDLTDIYRLGQPKWENVNGNMVNTNDPNFKGGFQPGMATSANGQVTQWQPDGQGGVAVRAPTGALDTFRAYQDAEQRAKAQYDPVTYTPKGETSPRMASRLSLLDPGNGTAAPPQQPVIGRLPPPPASAVSPVPPGMQPVAGATGRFVGDPADAMNQIAQIADPQERVNALAALQQQMRAAGANSGPLQPPGIELQSPATAKFNDSVATNEAGQVNEAYTKAAAAKQSLPALWQAQELLKSGTFTGMGAEQKMGVLRALSSMGLPVPDSVANSQNFDATISQIVGKNIKAMVGSNGISNSDVKFVQGMFGQRGQEAKAIAYILDKAVQQNFRDIGNYNGMLPGIQANGGQTTLGQVQAPQQPGGMTRVASDAEYSALPPGTSFIGPDGKTRRKP